MRKILMAVLLAALVAVPAASAKNPHDQTEPSPSVTVILSGPTPIAKAQIPAGGLAAAAPEGASTAADCGACIVTCWTAATRTGPTDWSGHVFMYQHLYWCGNGAWVTQASVWQSYDQSGWYTLSSAYGPWWSGGCVGCSTIQASGYILWNWTSPLIGLAHSGTSSLTSTMYAYGGLSV